MNVRGEKRSSLVVLCLLVLAAGCTLFNGNPDPEPEPLFAPGEYGGDPLPGTEEFQNVRISPDGKRVAFVRLRTPGEGLSPRKQLWVVDRDGSHPELVGLWLGTVDWSPGGSKLAVTMGLGIQRYIYTIDLENRTFEQWTGLEDQKLSGYTTNLPIWFQNGKRLLVSVSGKAYQQPYPRGIYVIDMRDSLTTGPLLEYFQTAFISESERHLTGIKYFPEDHPDRSQEGNMARYDIEEDTWEWITTLPPDSVNPHVVRPAVATPAHDQLVQARRIDNAWQLFLMRNDGTGLRQVTELGGDNPNWTYDGRRVIFRRDVHRGEGARYVPFILDIETGEESPLWPALPDSFPELPPLETQEPILVP